MRPSQFERGYNNECPPPPRGADEHPLVAAVEAYAAGPVSAEAQAIIDEAEARAYGRPGAQPYQRKPATVTAIQWTGENLTAVQSFCLPQSPMTHGAEDLAVQTLDHLSMAQYPSLGRQLKMEFLKLHDWLVRGADGELEVVAAALFTAEYLPVAEPLAPGESDSRD